MTTLIILSLFILTMIGISYASRRQNVSTSINEFLVSSRDVGVWRGAFSIAVSWVWAPAIFIVGMQAYTQGVAGAFWFIVPNIFCFFLFAKVAKRLRQNFPNGFTLPQFIKTRFQSKRTHRAFLTLSFGYQLGAIIINCVAGGTLLHLLTGIDYETAVVVISATALLYSVIGGMRASIVTDVIQMTIVLGLAAFIVPWVIIESGGWTAINNGLPGISNTGGNIFDPSIAWAFGIPMTISLLAGPIGDQQFFQRAFAVKKSAVTRTFQFGGIIFGFVPVILSILGFIAANQAFGIIVDDPQMVAPIVIEHFLPNWVLGLFTLMAFAGLCSTIDSAYCAISSFSVADLSHKKLTERQKIKHARITMIVSGILGTGIALFQPKLLWIFLIYGALVAVGFFPTLFSVFKKNYSESAAFWSIILGFFGTIPLSIWANVSENTNLITWSSILSVGIGLIVSGLFWRKN